MSSGGRTVPDYDADVYTIGSKRIQVSIAMNESRVAQIGGNLNIICLTLQQTYLQDIFAMRSVRGAGFEPADPFGTGS